jgi:hypothetical protein
MFVFVLHTLLMFGFQSMQGDVFCDCGTLQTPGNNEEIIYQNRNTVYKQLDCFEECWKMIKMTKENALYYLGNPDSRTTIGKHQLYRFYITQEIKLQAVFARNKFSNFGEIP